MQLYWGDLHNHCDISYGYGSLTNALLQARRQLDFCAVVGHATWHDMPRDSRWNQITDYHQKGFRHLSEQWDTVRQTVEAAYHPHEFVTFHGFEAHSSHYGDRHVISPDPSLPLIEAATPEELCNLLRPWRGMAIPHHIGYVPGYRGINWSMFARASSPVVEVYSKHGCAMDDVSAYPYLHTMGPRDGRNTVLAGLAKGFRFGFIGSTDHHAGYPGSYGDGLVAVWAQEKTREGIEEALTARRTYAVTGDKIRCEFYVNHLTMGMEGEIDGPPRLHVAVRGSHALDRITIYKNLRPWRVVAPRPDAIEALSARYKIRVEMGWGDSSEPYRWDVSCTIHGGRLVGTESQFRGYNALAPSRDHIGDSSINAQKNVIHEVHETSVSWTCETQANISTLHAQTCSVVLEVEGDSSTALGLQINSKACRIFLRDLRQYSQGEHMDTYCSEAFLVHRAIPEAAYAYETFLDDDRGDSEWQNYFLVVQQSNNQWAWVSPVFVRTP